MIFRFYTLLIFFFLYFPLLSQVSFTANDSVFHYQGQFRAGYNSGFAAGWNDLTIATLAAGDPQKFVVGVGMKSNRDALFFEALDTYGYASKMDEVVHYDSLGLQDLTALVLGGEDGFRPEPPAPFRDTTHYCPNKQSTLFANLYEPIWDDGSDGTPYNEENYFAAYMYKTVNQYKDFVTFWEIWNEPGFDYSGNRGWRMQGDTIGNWWDNDPDPCDYKLGAPIQHYVRTLRIAWEIVKTLDPESFVCMGAAGFPSFVDAVSRNTDNPNGGVVTSDFPQKGGAYFDAMIYHSFPHIDGGFVESLDPYKIVRNSDVAANHVIKQRNNFEAVLEKYGYDGQTYPRKQFLITEINLPRKIFTYTNQTYGGQIAQLNFMMKALLNCKINNILQAHVYTFGELRTEGEATNEFDLMGLYQNMDSTNFYNVQPTSAGVGVKTMLPMLWNTTYDSLRSAALQNNPDVRIEAFQRADGSYLYALWAIMKQDFNEFGTAKYSFPTNLNIPNFFKKYTWLNSITGESFISSNTDISVDGTPMFLVEDDVQNLALPDFTLSQSSGCVPFTVEYTNTSVNADSVLWHFPNGIPEFSTGNNPSVSYTTEGYQTVEITAYNGLGAQKNKQDYFVHARDVPVPNFVGTPNFGNVFFLNYTFDADEVLWEFGDGVGTSTEFFPAYTYSKNGKYEVKLTATNPCGTAVYKDTIEILYALEVDFAASQMTGCAPFTTQFQAISPLATEYFWFFPDSDVDTSSAASPMVTYTVPGVYPVSLTVANGANSGTITKQGFITVLDEPAANFSYQDDELVVDFTNISTNAQSYLWAFGDGSTGVQQNPTHTYGQAGTYLVSLFAFGTCGVDTIRTSISIFEKPNTSFTQSVESGCAPFTVHYQNTGTTGTENAYFWTFPGGQPAESIDENPSVVYNTPGVYDVFFKILNPAGADSIMMASAVVVEAAVEANFTQISDFQMFSFTNTSQNATNYFWDFGDGFTSTEVNPDHSFNFSGDYVVQLIAQNTCSADTFNMMVDALPYAPSAELSFTVSGSCAPVMVDFIDESLGEVFSWNWSFPGGTPSASTDPDPTIVYENPGMYQATLSVGNISGFDTIMSIPIIVSYIPPTDFTVTTNLDELCVQLLQTSSVDSVFWDFGDGFTSTDLSPCHDYDLDSSAVVSIEVITYGLCGSDTLLQDIPLTIVSPQASFTSEITEGCVPLEVRFSALSSVADSVNWTFTGGTPNKSNALEPTITYLNAGHFPVKLIAFTAVGTDTLTETAYITGIPQPDAFFGFVIEEDSVFFQNQSTPVTGVFTWDFDDGTTSNAFDPNHLYLPGTYLVSLTVESECGTHTFTDDIVILTSQKFAPDGSVYVLYPNPSTGLVYIAHKGEHSTEYLDIQVFNALSQLVFEQKEHTTQSSLNVTDLASGLYVLKAKTKAGVVLEFQFLKN